MQFKSRYYIPFISLTILLVSVAIIVSSVLASTCVILIILVVYLFRVWRRKPEPQSHEIKHVKFPLITHVSQTVQPSLRHEEGSSSTHKQKPRHSYAGMVENLKANLDTSIYGPDMDEFYHNPTVKPNSKSHLKKSLSKWRIHSKSFENLGSEPISDKHGSSLSHKFSNSTDDLGSNLRHNRYGSDRNVQKNHNPLTNCLSIHNINTPPCQRFMPRNRQTWHSHHRELSPLLQNSTPSTSSESLDKLEPCHGDEISQPVMVGLTMYKCCKIIGSQMERAFSLTCI